MQCLVPPKLKPGLLSMLLFISNVLPLLHLMDRADIFHLFNSGTSHICPVGSDFLEPAFRNSPYQDSILWSPPVDSVVFGFNIPFDSFEVVNITGLAPGIDYNCLTTNCTWTNNPSTQTHAFIELVGNPGDSPPGKYPIQIELRYYMTFFSNVVTLDEIDSTLFIYLCPFENSDTDSEVQLSSEDNLNLGTITQEGYYFSSGTITAEGAIDQGKCIYFLSNNGSSFIPNFNVGAGSKLIAASCPH